MNFQTLLHDYYTKLGISQNDLAHASGLSAPVISRYLSGERKPASGSENLKALAKGLSSLAWENQILSSEFEYAEVLTSLELAIRSKEKQYDKFLPNFNALIDCFDIKMKELSDYLNFDTSFLYRVRTGERRPSDLDTFCSQFAKFITFRYSSPEYLDKAAKLWNLSPSELSSENDYSEQILRFLEAAPALSNGESDISGLLEKLENFNLDEYIQTIHFYDIKIPTSPIRFPVSKYYYGIEEMRKAELDFFKAAVLGKSSEPVFLYSDMPMMDLADDMDFNKKWMFGIAAVLKKGLHINMIHNLDRPLEEMMLGLEAWIPIYMTGQVSPYYLSGYKNDVFKILNYCSGNAALSAECMNGHPLDGRYHLSCQKRDIAYMRKRTNILLSEAKPLMKIYNSSKASEYREFLKKDFYVKKSDRHVIASALPLFTMPEELIKDLLSSLPDPAEEPQEKSLRQSVTEYLDFQKKSMEEILSENSVDYDYHILSAEEFASHPPAKNLPDLFLAAGSPYTYEQYRMHVEATRIFAASHDNFHFHETDEMIFRNIQITILPGKYFVVSKYKSPSIHFVISHPKLLSAMECFTPPNRRENSLAR